MCEKSEKKSKNIMLAEEGVIASQYTQNGWFVKVKATALNIDKIIFSFVEKGKKGSGFDIYIDIDKFDLWCDDIMSYRMEAIINNEKASGNKYPVKYKYITGENGEKSVGIGASTGSAFANINGCTVLSGKKCFANVPTDYDWLRIMAKKFKRVSKQRYDKLDEVYANAIKTLNGYHEELVDEEYTGEKKEEQEQTPKIYSEKSEKIMKLFSQTAFKITSDGYAFIATGIEGNNYNVIIPKSVTSSYSDDHLEKLCQMSGTDIVEITVDYENAVVQGYDVIKVKKII